eukprot:268336_1
MTAKINVNANIYCLESESCMFTVNNLISTTSIANINIYCNNPSFSYFGACDESYWNIYGKGNNNITIDCDQNDCYLAEFHIDEFYAVDVNCETPYSCMDIVIQAETSQNLKLNCSNERVCAFANVYCPIVEMQTCHIKCSQHTYACASMQIYSNECDEIHAEYDDSWLICNIFKNTNISDSIEWWNTATRNYCDWIVDPGYFDCSNNRIIDIDIDKFHLNNYMELDTSYQWPSQLQFLSLDVNSGNILGGIWHWNSVKNLLRLTRIDISDTEFSGIMNNSVWNMLLTELPTLVEIDIDDASFTANMSEISLNKRSNITRLEIKNNMFYGTISSDFDFFTKLPKIQVLQLAGNVELEGYFENVDFLLNMPNLTIFDVTNTKLGGSIKLSESLSLPESIDKFAIRATNFEYIDFSIFEKLFELHMLDISDNSQLDGQNIDWDVIGNLSFSNLNEFYGRYVLWAGYADFSSISESLYIELDVDYLCDPQIYPCPSQQIPAPRSNVKCEGKSECELSCRCSLYSTNPTQSPTVTLTQTEVTLTQPTVTLTQPTEYSITNLRTIYIMFGVMFVLVLIIVLGLSWICCKCRKKQTIKYSAANQEEKNHERTNVVNPIDKKPNINDNNIEMTQIESDHKENDTILQLNKEKISNVMVICLGITTYDKKEPLADVRNDIQNYKKILGDQYRYRVLSSLDKYTTGRITKNDMETFIASCQNQIVDYTTQGHPVLYEALFVTISGHGNAEGLICSDDEIIRFDTIRETFSNEKSLQAIPRIFCI